MHHPINYKRIFTLLAIAISIIAVLLYIGLTENDTKDYQFVGEWNCKQKESVEVMRLKITDSSIFENNKKLHDYYPETSKVRENTYNIYHGNERFARIKEINENKISFKKNVKKSKSYYCKRDVVTKA